MRSLVNINILLCLLLFFPVIMSAQQDAADCFRVYLKDKRDSPYSLSNPREFLSQRSVEKRLRFTIVLTEEDLPINQIYVDTILSKSPIVKVLAKSKWFNTVTIYCPDSSVCRHIRNLPFVDSILPVATYKEWFNIFGFQERNVSNLLRENMSDSYDIGDDPLFLHKGRELHAEGYYGEGMLIAVIDAGWTGFDTLSFFTSLYDRGGVIGTRDLIPFMSNVYSYHSHGTAVTSVMCANEEGIMIGSAPGADYFFIRSENPLDEQLIEEDFWVQAAEMADSLGADVINSSLGYTTFRDFPQAERSYDQCDGISSIASLAATKAGEKGIVVCVAAGNDGSNPWRYMGRPSDAFDILGIGAIGIDSIPASFTSHGPSYDGRIKPDVVSMGVHTPVVDADGTLYTSHGTSLAAPVIAGLTACLWQALPEKNSSQIMQIIRESAHQYRSPDTLMGYGIPNFYKAYVDHKSNAVVNNYASGYHNIVPFPNPCRDQFKVWNSDGEITVISLFDLQGRQVRKVTTAGQMIIAVDMDNLKPGTYIGKVTLKNGIGQFKVIKAE